MRQDEFIYLDLVRQFRSPEKQQILPINFTKEIIDETSILYKEDPIHQIVDSSGRILKKDQELWEEIKKDSRYLMIMDKVDRWAKLLGTVMVKVGFVDPNTGELVESDKGGQVQLDVLHGGIYDVKYGASPYFITELMIGFGKSFGGFAGESSRKSLNLGIPGQTSSYGLNNNLVPYDQLGSTNTIYWSPDSHLITDEKNNAYETKNPYGIIPAVPFFNQDPAHYYFLPVNEPLIYANHALNMRITDLNHIAKFQSFGIPVIKGAERGKGIRQGRPVDDFNQLKGGSAQSRFGGVGGISGFGAGGQHRTFDGGLGIFRDGNADANALGMSLGPDTAIAVGEKGDFKFAHPNADINGLVKSIQAMSDMVRINHGLRPKYTDKIPPSGFAAWMEKQGVMDENAGRRGKIFAEREAQLFQVIKKLWNTHHNSAGSKRFTEDSKLEVTYVPPKFPLDPKTNMEKVTMELKLLETGSRQAFKELYPYLTDMEINKLIKQNRKDKMEQAIEDAKIEVEKAKMFEEAGIAQMQQSKTVASKDFKTTASSSTSIKGDAESDNKVGGNKIDNRAKQAADSSESKKTENEVKKDK